MQTAERRIQNLEKGPPGSGFFIPNSAFCVLRSAFLKNVRTAANWVHKNRPSTAASAVSTRKTRGPNDTTSNPHRSNEDNSEEIHPPSGPIATVNGNDKGTVAPPGCATTARVPAMIDGSSSSTNGRNNRRHSITGGTVSTACSRPATICA